MVRIYMRLTLFVQSETDTKMIIKRFIKKTTHFLFSELFPPRFSYVNWISDNQKPNTFWIERLIRIYHLQRKRPIRFYSLFGKRETIDEKFPGIKIFFSGENLEPYVHHSCLIEDEKSSYRTFFKNQIPSYADYAIGSVDLSLGFGNRKDDNYLRLPLWMIQFFPPTINKTEIKKILDNIETRHNSFTSKNAVIVARHDFFGSRKKICSDLEKITEIDYAGKWNNSTDILYTKYNDDKQKLLREYKFNICAENQDAPFYVTEKLYQAFIGGCIPIYQGALNDPEPDVINKDAVILWNFDSSNDANLLLVDNLIHDQKVYNDFISRPKFKPYAAEFICDTFSDLRSRLTKIL